MKTFVKILVFIFSSIVILVLFALLKVELHNQGTYVATSWIGNGAIGILFYILFLVPKKSVKKEKDYNKINFQKPNKSFFENSNIFKGFKIKSKTFLFFYLSIIIIICFLAFLDLTGLKIW
jgi:hypothetical protein